MKRPITLAQLFIVAALFSVTLIYACSDGRNSQPEETTTVVTPDSTTSPEDPTIRRGTSDFSNSSKTHQLGTTACSTLTKIKMDSIADMIHPAITDLDGCVPSCIDTLTSCTLTYTKATGKYSGSFNATNASRKNNFTIVDSIGKKLDKILRNGTGCSSPTNTTFSRSLNGAIIVVVSDGGPGN
jgi:hypothetical protein